MRVLSTLFLAFLAGETHALYRDFGIPASNSVVDVRVFNTGFSTLVNEAHAFTLPVLPGRETPTFPIYAFLLEHKTSGTRFVWDLEIRKDHLSFAPSVAQFFTSGVVTIASADKDVPELLQDGGIALDTIDNVFWSHSHFDHIGDMSKFPTPLAFDFVGHNVTKIDFEAANLTFSGMKAVDYFGDGSFYLLDSPGHISGHMAALARVTPTSFVSLGGDTFHNAAEARPRPQFQLNYPCPAHLVEEIKSSVSTDYFWSPYSRDGDPVAAQVSLEKIATFDSDPDFFVVVAHDASLQESLPYFPESLNNWKETHLKDNTLWNFANQTNPAFVFSPAVNHTM
ncbi:hypothetical protein C8F04DRAFT_1251070 [Mycena alexandri]|uniref:Metallo-beta-lactamase domain-containing protein n=1 Tax=Mycena alexandri TaxID=1745969 RepID=A0AAD6XCU1_9AGAR|nr:hypothetical protein C8F04DRAFT_1251070 [Mycena alexandri]